MEKRNIFSIVTGIGVGTLTYFLLDRTGSNHSAENNNLPIEKAGKPELDQFENSKMVSEGSQFGVNYYNKLRET